MTDHFSGTKDAFLAAVVHGIERHAATSADEPVTVSEPEATIGYTLHAKAESILKPILLAQGRFPGAYSSEEYGLALSAAQAEIGEPIREQTEERIDGPRLAERASQILATAGKDPADVTYEEYSDALMRAQSESTND